MKTEVRSCKTEDLKIYYKTQEIFLEFFYSNNTDAKAKIAGKACTKNIFLEAESAP